MRFWLLILCAFLHNLAPLCAPHFGAQAAATSQARLSALEAQAARREAEEELAWLRAEMARLRDSRETEP